MSLEKKLLSALTTPEKIAQVYEMGLRTEAFEEPFSDHIYDFIVEYWIKSQMAAAPTLSMITTERPGFPVYEAVEEEPWWLAEQLMKRAITNHVQEMLIDASSAAQDDPIAALHNLREESYLATEKIVPRHSRSDMSDYEARRRRYRAREEGREISMSYGLPGLDEHTGCLLPGELCVMGAYSGVGKCVGKDTYVFTDAGLVQIGEIDKELGEGGLASCVSGVSTRDGKGTTSALYHRGKDDGVEVFSRFSRVTSTREHRFLVPTVGGLEWKHAGDLVVGDQLLMDTSCDSVRDFKGSTVLADGTELTPALAGLLGWATAEGNITKSDDRILNLVITKHGGTEYGDSNSADIVARSLAVFGSSPARRDDRGWYFNREHTRWLVNVAGLEPVTAAFKKIPPCILSAPTHLVTEFLRCYFEGDGDYSRGISVCSASKILMEQVAQLLLCHFGVVSELKPKEVQLEDWDTPRTYWVLKMPRGDNGRKFAESIVPISTYTTLRLARHTLEDRGRTTRSCNLGRVRYTREWTSRVIRHLRSVVPDTERCWIPAAPHHRERCYQNLFPSKNSTATMAMTKFSTHDFSPPQVIELVKCLSRYEKHLQSFPEWEALVECARKRYVSSEVLNIGECVDDFWDFTVEDTHSYVASGIMSHNTMMLMHIAAVTRKLGYTPIIFTLEMSVEDIEEKVDAMVSGVSYNRLTKRRLTPQEQWWLHSCQEYVTDNMGQILIEKPVRGERTVAHLISRARQVKADLVLIDQLSHVESTRKFTNEKMRKADIMETLHDEIGKDSLGKLPCIMAAQLKRESLDRPELRLDDFADAAEVERFSDFALGIARDRQLQTNRMARMEVLKGRRGGEASWILSWDLVDKTLIQEYERIQR